MTDTTTSNDSATDQAKEAANRARDAASEQASEVAGTAQDEARSVVSDARDQAADVVSAARTELHSRATEHTQSLSSTLGELGRQLDDMATNSTDPQAQVAALARSAAGTLDRGAKRLDDRGLDGLVDDVKGFARRRPGAFVLGSVVAGFAIGRLAKHADLRQAAEQAKGELDTDALTTNGSSATDGAAVPTSTAPPVDASTAPPVVVTGAAPTGATPPRGTGVTP